MMGHKAIGILFMLVFVSLILTVGTTYFLNLNQGKIGITGLIIEDEDNYEGDVIRVSREDAVEAIVDIRDIISEMDEKEFNTRFFEDLLFGAERSLERVDFVFTVRDDSLPYSEKREAQSALRLVEGWERIEDYSEVISYLEECVEVREKALLSRDLLPSIKKRIENENSEDVKLSPGRAQQLYDNAEVAFAEERYADAEQILMSARDEIEAQKSAGARLAVLRRGALNFFQRNWEILSILFIISIVITYFAYGRISKSLLAKKINKMGLERTAIIELIRKTQNQRFKENSIPGLVYDIRMKKFQDRLSRIKEELPVLELKFSKKRRFRY